MNLMIAKWGNSLGLRIPSAIAKEAGLAEGASVSLSVRKGRIVAEPIRYTLDALVKGIAPKNRHDETDAGAAQGHEVW